MSKFHLDEQGKAEFHSIATECLDHALQELHTIKYLFEDVAGYGNFLRRVDSAEGKLINILYALRDL